ncbi:hypothetical protein CLV30_103216 [Haloactinopolyspora alba]|uniref:Quercetin dioxygenase-like cupin family protein n=2 Tax=Haloactinopolyspora alba TaxID=648780 RepID=A0A2P8E9A7_9ACTN|nr:hypothetical protein CLV30_103216 [Haloactinopolyspora alba]
MTLHTAGTDQLETARQSSAGRSSRTMHSGKHLRQTLIALTEGTKLAEHQSPGDATIMCLRGQVTLHCGTRTVVVTEGHLVDVPAQRHDLVADTEALVLLTVGLG